MARSGSLPVLLSRVHPVTRTPWNAVAVVTLGAIGFVFFGDIEFVANVTNYTLFFTFIAINISVILLRYRIPHAKRPFTAPLHIGSMPVMPVVGLASCILLLLQLEPDVLAVGVLITIAGAVIATILALRKKNRDL